MKQKSYPIYKASGVEWLSDVPDYWEVKRLKYSFQLLTTKTENHANPIALENIESWTGRLIVTETEFDGEGIAFVKDDILFGKLRPYLAKVLKAERPGEAVGDFFVIRPQQSMNPEYAAFTLRSEDFINIIDGSTFGSKMPRASWEFMGGVKIPLPPLTEQQSIAAFLDRETGRIDTLVAKKERLIELLREKRSALISHAVTRGLDPSVKLKPSGVEWLGDVPEHWKVKRLKHLFSIWGRIGYRGYTTEDLVDEGQGAFALGASHITAKGHVDLSEPVFISWQKYFESPEIMVSIHDLIVVQRGSCGKVALVDYDLGPATINPSLILLKNAKAFPKFILYVLLSSYIQSRIITILSSTAVPMLSQEQVANFTVILPPHPEQQSIAAFLDRETRKIDALIAKVEAAIAKLKEYRTGLISAAVTGKIDVREVV